MDNHTPEPVVAHYVEAFRASMWVAPRDLGSLGALQAAIERLDPVARDLLDTLRLAVGPGETVPERFRRDIESDGDDLWRAGLLFPRVTPSPGATIDPRYYGAMCRLNPALRSAPIWRELQDSTERVAHPPPSHVQADATIVAAALEASPLRLTQAGVVRKDDLRRFLSSMGPDTERWTLALGIARAAGLVRAAGPTLCGYPESKPRPVTNPLGLLDDPGVAAAAALLLRVVGPGWLVLELLQEALRTRCPEVLAPKTRPRTRWKRREGPWIAEAARWLHRLGLIDGHLGREGVEALRRRTVPPERVGGFLLTPDREVLVDPRELPDRVYGRLCRVAPYLEGDMMHRHRLTLDGVSADLAQGYDDLEGWLAQWSRTGVPGNVASSIRDWQRSAVRIRLFSGVSVLEDPTRTHDRFTVLDGPAPPDSRELHYRGEVPARLEVVSGVVRVPYGRDALTVRVLADKVGMPVEPGPLGWRWEIAPEAVADPDAFLQALARFHEGPLPGELEAAVLGAAGTLSARAEPCTLVVLPERAADALFRDRLAGPMLTRRLDHRTCIVLDADLAVVRGRLEWLGFTWEHDVSSEETSDPDTAPSGLATQAGSG